MSGLRLQRGARRRQGPDRTAWCLSVKPSWGKPTGRHCRGGGWQRERWWDEAPAPQSKERRSETPNRRLRASVLYPTGNAGQHERLEGPLGETPGSPTVSRQLQSIAQPAQRYPEMVVNNVLHLIDHDFLLAASQLPRKQSAPGVDQVTATPYAEHRDDNLRDLHERLRDHRYMAPPVERVWIEKDDGKKRPRGKPCFEDKMVQRAVVMLLEAIVEPDLHAFSHGFRQGHSPHQALHALREQCRTLPSNWRVEADGSGCCDHLGWSQLREFLQQRVSDGGRFRLRGKWLHAGVLEAGALMHPDKGTPPGGGIAPMRANVFLQHVLDEWCVKAVPPRRQGRGFLRRLADDCIIGCECEAEARRILDVLPQRFPRFRLTMHPEKTALMAFKRPPSRHPSAGGTGTFAFLGLTHSWGKTRQGYWGIKRKTVGQRLRRFRKESWTGCREHRHAPLQEPYRTLGTKLRGSYQYDGRRGNCKRLEVVFEHTERAWHSWLSTRSPKGHINWQKFEGFLRQKLPLPKPRILHNISQGQGQQSDAPNGVSPVW
jgi:RNA-directed DNA polymerase